MSGRPCECDRFVPGEPFVAGRDCSNCWLFAHRPSVREAWGGDPAGVRPMAAVDLARMDHATRRISTDPDGRTWSLTIVTCPGRELVLGETLGSIARSDWPHAPTVVRQPANWTTGWESTSRNYRQALDSAWNSEADLSVVLEDDVLVGEYLWHNLTNWWPARSGQVRFASLFIPHLIRDPFEREHPELGYRIGHPHRANGPEDRWVHDRLWGSQAYVFDRIGLRAMLDDWDGFESGGQDARAITVAGRQGWPLLYSLPCLVEHNPRQSAFGSPRALAPDFDAGFRFTDRAPPSIYRHPELVPGWLTYSEGRLLWELARDRRVLELGRHAGRSTCAMAQSARELVSVDRESARDAAGWLPVFSSSCRVELVESLFSEIPEGHLSEPFDLVFIDGEHVEPAIRADVAIATSHLKRGGILAFHDYLEAAWPDVQRTVDSFARLHGWKRLRQVDRLAAFRIGSP